MQPDNSHNKNEKTMMSAPKLVIQKAYVNYLLFSLRTILFSMVVAFTITNAHAGLKFGGDDTIRQIGTTSLQGPNGEQLYIGRLTTMRSFALPYTIEDKGYVLGVTGDYKRYYIMPEGEFLKQAQQEGLLPTPLPPYEIDNITWALGHSLWIALAGLILYAGYKKAFKKKPAFKFNETESQAYKEPTPSYFGPEINLPAKLVSSKRKHVGLLLISILLAFASYFVVTSGDEMGYFGLILFGVLGIPVSLIQIFTDKSYLEMDSEKFTYSTFFKKKSFLWKDVERFDLWTMYSNKFVRWTPNAHYQGDAVNPVVSSLVGKGLMLPDTYGMKAEVLVEMMNEIRRRVSTQT